MFSFLGASVLLEQPISIKAENVAKMIILFMFQYLLVCYNVAQRLV
jgi:hypothetical protein